MRKHLVPYVLKVDGNGTIFNLSNMKNSITLPLLLCSMAVITSCNRENQTTAKPEYFKDKVVSKSDSIIARFNKNKPLHEMFSKHTDSVIYYSRKFNKSGKKKYRDSLYVHAEICKAVYNKMYSK